MATHCVSRAPPDALNPAAVGEGVAVALGPPPHGPRRPWRDPIRVGKAGDAPSQRACNARRCVRDGGRQRSGL